MKFHETHFDEYLARVEEYNFHPELVSTYENNQSSDIGQMGNMIIYGPSGVGKYSQMLRSIKKYSPSGLKYDKKMMMQTDKYQHSYRISDIHYEIDMALLGCNSKMIWHEVFSQIVDIVSMKPCKHGIIVCKNFQSIHNELLEIFYSYMQQYNHPSLNIQIKYILLSEHICFIPNNILLCCRTMNVKRPPPEYYKQITESFDQIDPACIMNLKEIIPTEVFDVICREIIAYMANYQAFDIIKFRDMLYDILVYNLDVMECYWNVLTYFIDNKRIDAEDITTLLSKSYGQFKYYNNNYRPIYHLETMFITIVTCLHK
jgi:hypothetical protein